MLTRRDLLAAGAASLAAAFPWPALASAREGLAKLAAQRGILFGTATSTNQLADNSFVPHLLRDASILVPEYEMKRALIQPEPGRFDFSHMDSLVEFAGANGMAMRGHPLVWHKRNPDWLEGALLSSRKESLLTAYVQTLVSRYRGRMHSWDVVNEALALDGTTPMRGTVWLKAFGPEYIDLAFHTAREADPNALLVYNDWGCEAGASDAFRTRTLDFLESALARGVPIQAYGMQGHLSAFGPQVDQKKLADFIGHLKSMGLKLLVTELDVDDSGGPLDIAARDRAVADATRRFLDVAVDSPATLAVLTWGLSDRFLDPPGWRDVLKGYSPRTLPLDRDLNAKPMWDAIADALSRPRMRLSSD